MKKITAISLILLSVLIFSSCNNELPGNKPPEVFVKVNGKRYDAVLGTYCWKKKCVDTLGPIELWKGNEPIQVNVGEEITVDMDYTPKPNVVYFSQFIDDDSEIKINPDQFSAPKEKGRYYYVYSVWWGDEKRENYSLGDAYYVFEIEVK